MLKEIDDLLLEASQLRCKVRFNNLLPEIYEVEDDYEIDELNMYPCADGDCHCGEARDNLGFASDTSFGLWIMKFRVNYETLIHLAEQYGEDYVIHLGDGTYKVGDILSRLNNKTTEKFPPLTATQG